MWNRIVKRVQSPRTQGPRSPSKHVSLHDGGKNKAKKLGGDGNRHMENKAPATNLKENANGDESVIKTLEGQFSEMQRERDAARFVSVSIANAAVSLKHENHKELLDEQAKAIAWKCIATAALELKAEAH